MRQFLYKILPACMMMLAVVGCKEDVIEISIGQEQKLTTEISTPSTIFGDKVTFTVKMDGMSDTTLVMQEDIDVRLTFSGKDKDGRDVSAEEVFSDFPGSLHLRKGDQQGSVDLTVKEAIANFPITGTLTAYARGYQISPADRSFTVADKYYLVMALRNNSDLLVSEGTSMVLTATLGTTAKEDVNIQIESDDRDKFEEDYPLPEVLTIKKGFRSAESEPVRVKLTEGANGYDAISLRYVSNQEDLYPLSSSEMRVVVRDVDANLGSPFEDERNVYTLPEQVFYSEETAMEVSAWDNAKFADGRLMKLGDPHPNKKLADKGWNFLNSLEFHPVSSLTVGGKANEWDNRVPRYLAMQAVENTQVYQAMNNAKYSNMTDEGYLMMWSAYNPGEQILEAGAGTRDYGVSGFYANKFKGGNAVNDTWESSNVRILPGTRVEIRMRLRGEKRSFNAALWTQGNRDAGDNAVQWSAYGECDILENPANSSNDNDAWQTFHWADNPNQTTQADNNNPNNNGPQLKNMKEFNIYWLEWRDNEEIAMGINGKEEVTIKASQYPNKWNHWPFSDEFNSEGMHLLLTFGCGSDWALGMQLNPSASEEEKAKHKEKIKAEVDKVLKNIPYAGSKTNPNTPRMEIDWIRFYKKSNYLYRGNGVVQWKNYPMY